MAKAKKAAPKKAANTKKANPKNLDGRLIEAGFINDGGGTYTRGDKRVIIPQPAPMQFFQGGSDQPVYQGSMQPDNAFLKTFFADDVEDSTNAER
jgi:hypothetical protein